MCTARLLTYPIVSDGGLPKTPPLDADPLMQTLLDADPPPPMQTSQADRPQADKTPMQTNPL